jgi:hypothetical protein
MDDTALSNLTGTEQIKVMENLTQQAAGWLLGLTARTMRDWPTIPRGADGRYNAAALVKWQAGRVERANLADTEYETLLTIAEATDIDGLAGAVKALGDLRRAYGAGILAEFGEILLGKWGEILDASPEHFGAPTPADLRQKDEARRKADAEAEARRELRIATICDACKKLRRGRRWIKAGPPAGFVVMADLCPACAAAAR